MSDSLTEGWTTRPLSEVAGKVQYGWTTRARSTGDVRLLRTTDITSGAVSWDSVPWCEEPPPSVEKYELHPGDIVVSRAGSVGFNYMVDDSCPPRTVFASYLMRIRPNPDVLEPGLLQHFMASPDYWSYISDAAIGIGMANVNGTKLGTLPVPIPPRNQQARLLDILNRTRDSTATVLSRVGASRQSLGRALHAVVAAACSGRLSADWRADHQPAVDGLALANQISGVRKARLGKRHSFAEPPDGPYELPATWTWTTVGALVDVATGATPLRRNPAFYGGGIPWVTSGAVNSGTIMASKETITELALAQTNAKVFPKGTLLVAMYGEGQTRGRVAELGIDAATNQALAALIFDEETARLRPYLRLFLLANYARIRSQSVGGVQPNLSLGMIKEMPVPLPPIEEQALICVRAAEVLAVVEEVRHRINAAESAVTRAANGAAAKAFRGELGT